MQDGTIQADAFYTSITGMESMRMKRFCALFSMAILSLATLTGVTVSGQNATQKPNSFPLWNFDEENHSCRAKGRLQDKEYCNSKLMDRIVAEGKEAVPILISQLTDTRKTAEPIYDYWTYTTVGDIARFILDGLFTDSDWTTFNMPGLEALHDNCQDTSEVCWRKFLKRHGRKFVQEQWLAAWNANKDRVFWDEHARCFRLSPKGRAR
jgi:hypothetical protein